MELDGMVRVGKCARVATMWESVSQGNLNKKSYRFSWCYLSFSYYLFVFYNLKKINRPKFKIMKYAIKNSITLN